VVHSAVNSDASLVFLETSAGGNLYFQLENGVYMPKSLSASWSTLKFSSNNSYFITYNDSNISFYNVTQGSPSAIASRLYVNGPNPALLWAHVNDSGQINVVARIPGGISWTTFDQSLSDSSSGTHSYIPLEAAARDPALPFAIAVSPLSNYLAIGSHASVAVWGREPSLGHLGVVDAAVRPILNDQVLASETLPEGRFAEDESEFRSFSLKSIKDFSMTPGLVPRIPNNSKLIVKSLKDDGNYFFSTRKSNATYSVDTQILTIKDFQVSVGGDVMNSLADGESFVHTALNFNVTEVISPLGSWGDPTRSRLTEVRSSPNGKFAVLTSESLSDLDRYSRTTWVWSVSEGRMSGPFLGQICYLANDGSLFLSKNPSLITRVETKTPPLEQLWEKGFCSSGSEQVVSSGKGESERYINKQNELRNIFDDSFIQQLDRVAQDALIYSQKDYDYDGKHFLGLYEDKEGGKHFQFHSESFDLDRQRTYFHTYPGFALISNVQNSGYAEKGESNIFDFASRSMIKVPGVMVTQAPAIRSRKTGISVLPMYYPEEDALRMLPYDLDSLLKLSCLHLRKQDIQSSEAQRLCAALLNTRD
jgi:hypothetical protein